MYRKVFYGIMVIALAAGLTGSMAAVSGGAAKVPVAIGALPQTGVHRVAPREDKVVQELQAAGKISKGADSTVIQAAVQDYASSFAKKTNTWVNPQIEAAAMEHEKALAGVKTAGASPTIDPAVVPVTVQIFALAVEFTGTDTLTDVSVLTDYDAEGNPICETQDFTLTGPAQGEIPAPGPLDNNTIWYTADQTADPSFYGKLIFGYDGVGRVRMDLTDPIDGQPGINLAGYTVQDYYDKVSGAKGNVTLNGTVNGWVSVDHSEGYYGAPNCDAGNDDGGAGKPVAQLVIDAADAFNTANPGFEWSVYDKDGDHFVDTFWLIHAGMGEEAGGGDQGPFAVWSHSSDLRFYAAWPEGYQVAGAATPADPNDDIFIGPYTMQPENLDMGVLAEEFGHNVFGLPDMYTTDAENSVGFWNIMASGSWGGYLGGATPVGMPLWFRMIATCGAEFCNWQYPMLDINYDDPTQEVTIGQLEDTPVGVFKGVRINLPNVEEDIPNNAGTGRGAWSGAGRDQIDLTLDRDVAVPASGAAVLSFDSYWEIEKGWDYGYLMVKDGAAAWAYLPDMDGVFTTTNPNSNNLGVGLTGFAVATTNLRFDLAAYAGKTVTLRLRYKTDAATTEKGWWVDNVKMNATLLDDFSGASEPGVFPGWTNSTPNGWKVVPIHASYPNYYLVEWRAATKYDQMLRTAYITTYSDADEWNVERVPYNIPGALVYYRTQKYPQNYSQRPWYGDPPSFGPKNKLLVVDMNPDPLRAGTRVLNARSGSYDAALTLQDPQAFNISKIYGIDGGPWSFASESAVTKFFDALGYYPGFFYGDPCDPGYLCYTNRDGSAVIPARDLYSTRITDFDGNPLTDLYGIEFPPSWLGSGNPIDDGVHYGVSVELLQKSLTGDTGTLLLNGQVDYSTKVTTQISGGKLQVTYTTTVTNYSTRDLYNFMLAYLLDPALTPVSIGTQSANVAINPVLWSIPELKVGESKVVTLVTTANIPPTGFLDMLTLMQAKDENSSHVWVFPTTSHFFWLPVISN